MSPDKEGRKLRICCWVAKSSLPLCDPVDCGTSGSPALQYLLEFAEFHAHWVDDTISFSAIPISSCAQSFPASGSFPMSQLITSGGRSIRALASVLPMNIQDWFPLGLTGLFSMQSKGLLRVFSSTAVWRHQFFSAQPFLLSNFHICTWLLEKP